MDNIIASQLPCSLLPAEINQLNCMKLRKIVFGMTREYKIIIVPKLSVLPKMQCDKHLRKRYK